MQVHLLVLAGGTGERLGGRSKADLCLGQRLLDLLLEGCAPSVTGQTVVVAPSTVGVPDGMWRVLEDPPLGGPLAGIGTGIDHLLTHGARDTNHGVAVGIVSVDSPGFVTIFPQLQAALAQAPERDGAIAFGGSPKAFDQYLMGVYRLGALNACLTQVRSQSPSGLRDQGVCKWLGALDLERVSSTAELCRDIDTPDDLVWWRSFMNCSQAGDRSSQGGGQES